MKFEGEHYALTLLQPFFNPGAIEHPDIPIFAGAVGPDMTRMVGRVADGMITHPTNTPPEYIREICLPRLQAGFDRAGRSGESFKLMLGPLTATGKNEEVLLAEKEKQRALLGFLYSTPSYWPTLELLGWQDKGQQLLDMTREGSWEKMPSIITDEVLERIIPIGTYDEIESVYRNRYEGLASRITFPMPEDPADDEQAGEVVRRLKRKTAA